MVSLDVDKDPNSIIDSLLTKTKQAINEVFPIEQLTKNESLISLNPWMTVEILRARKKRDKLKLKWIKSGKIPNSVEHIAYKKMRNQVTSMKRISKQNKLQKSCDEARGDGEKLWKVAKQAMNQS